MTIDNQSSSIHLLRYLWKYLSKNRKAEYKYIVLISLVAAAFELISIGAVIPYISILTNDELLKKIPYNDSVSNKDLYIIITCIFCFLVIISTLIRTFLIRFSSRVAFETAGELNSKIYSRMMHQSYQSYLLINSGQVIDILFRKVDEVIYYSVIPCINSITSLFTLLFVISFMVFFLPSSIIIGVFFFGSLYLFVLMLSKKALFECSKIADTTSSSNLKLLQESLGGFRDIVINNLADHFANLFTINDSKLRRSQSDVMYISLFPRFSIEAIGILSLIIAAFILMRNGDALLALPTLAAIAVSAQRILPAFQQIYSSRSTIEGSKVALIEVLKVIKMQRELTIDSNFIKNDIEIININNIRLSSVHFRYINSNSDVLKNINITINKGDRIAIIGSSGAGKSTLLDLLLGLIDPTAGKVLINNLEIDDNLKRVWRNKISHVPQSIFIADTSILENIAFGVSKDKIDINTVIACSKVAHIHEDIMNMNSGYNTIVGERGAFLSGGQRQRLGIARSLYKKTPYIFLDEGTSALDNLTESNVMNSILDFDKDITIIAITHRLNNIKYFNKIYHLSNHGISLNLTI